MEGSLYSSWVENTSGRLGLFVIHSQKCWQSLGIFLFNQNWFYSFFFPEMKSDWEQLLSLSLPVSSTSMKNTKSEGEEKMMSWWQKLANSTESLLFFPHIFNPMFTRLIAGLYFIYSSYCTHSQQMLNIGCLNTVTCYLHITPTGAALSWKPVSWSSRHTVFFADVNSRGGLSLSSHWVFVDVYG